jgi:hypothetical protein
MSLADWRISEEDEDGPRELTPAEGRWFVLGVMIVFCGLALGIVAWVW